MQDCGIFQLETTHTPQGDGNIFPMVCGLYRYGNNPHPARGRKPPRPSRSHASERNNPHPARGRKRYGGNGMISPSETTHTPQGDGNSPIPPRRIDLWRNNPHPARGRKRTALPPAPRRYETTHTPQGDGNVLSHQIRVDKMKQPTPRKGTETFCIFVIGIADSRNNPHPARGRKPAPSYSFRLSTGNSPHPARGRKRSIIIQYIKRHGNNPHPARGRKPCGPVM